MDEEGASQVDRPAAASAGRWRRPMVARDRSESHRAATPLELFFDLCFVVAVAFAASGLHHAIIKGQTQDGVVSFLAVFFAIWWAWMNFTWFASAYDTDDVPYRIATFIQMTGVLILASGIPRIFADFDFIIATAGYVVMRLAMVPQWLRAAHGDPSRRATDQRYAIGIFVAQIGWICLLLAPSTLYGAGFVAFAALELAIPVWAESKGPTTWHHRHIGERYGLFTLIVLGETVLAVTIAIQTALDAGHDEIDLALLAVAGLLTVFSMWWLYFDRPEAESETTSFRTFTWGYGHALVFASIAATGAGLAIAIDNEVGVAHVSAQIAALSMAVPVAVYLFSIWAIRVLKSQANVADLAMPIGAALALAAALAGLPVHVIAVDITLVATIKVVGSLRRHIAA